MSRETKDRVLGTIALVLMFVVIPTFAEHANSYYNRVAEVVSYNEKTQEVVVVDNTQNEWVFFGDNFRVGDDVKMRMFTNYTEDFIEDDMVVRARVIKK